MTSAHGHARSHAHAHSHAPTASSLSGNPRARRALLAALVVGMAVLLAEVVGGIAFGSLALLGDAAHMATDVGAYGIALWAARVASRPPSDSRTFGHGRAEILAALANGATLLAASAWILVEAVRRLLEPPNVDGVGMSALAAVGLVANVAILLVLLRAGSDSLNMRGAVLHAVGDLLGSVAALTAGIVVATTGWERADPVASILLTALIVVGAWRLVRASADVLLDAAPAHVGAERVGAVLVSVPGVLEAHDVHVWTMAPGTVAASAHVRVDASADPARALATMETALSRELGIAHSTLQLRVDRGTVPLETVPTLPVDEAIAWATEHVLAACPDLTRPLVAAAAGTAALGLAGAESAVSPVTLARRTLAALGRAPGTPEAQA